MSKRFNYFMPTPWSNAPRKAETIEKNTNEFPVNDKTEEVTENVQPSIDETQTIQAGAMTIEDFTQAPQQPSDDEPVENIVL